MAKIGNRVTREISQKYTIDRGKNTFVREHKNNPKDRIEVEIGDSKQPDTFYPQAKIKRWDNETNASFRYVDNEPGEAQIRTEGKVIKYVKPKVEFHAYDLDAGGVGEDGGLELELLLKEKPDSNKFEFSVQTKGLDFFYQPKLTPEEIAEGAERPIDVEGSYAVYHKTKGGMNRADGMEYKTGKAFHIYRPFIYDSEGNGVYGDLNLDEEKGVLTVTIDQNFLDTVVYPVVVDPTFGYTSVGSSYYTGVGAFQWGSKFTLSESADVTAMSVYSWNTSSTSRSLVMGIYDDSSGPNNLKATSATGLAGHELSDFYERSISTTLTTGDYWLICNSDTSFNLLRVYYDSGDTNQGEDQSRTYTGSLDDPYGSTSLSDYKYSIYATYTAVTIDTYTSSNTWTCPAGVTSVDVEVIGGGGGAGSSSTLNGGAGGGGGAYSRKNNISVTPSSNYTVTVGSGGAGGDGDDGADGGDSWFSSTGTVLAKGGAGGDWTSDLGGAGGAAGSGVGDTKYSGGDGGDNTTTARYGASGGGGAGTTEDGGDGINGTTSNSSGGAGGFELGGDGGEGNSDTTGGNGSTYGGGGGGARYGSGRVGGNGAGGYVRIIYEASATSTASVSPISTTFTAVALAALATFTAVVSPISTTYTTPPTTATYSSVGTASVNPTNVTYTVPSTTATHQVVFNAGVSPQPTTYTIPNVSSTYDAILSGVVTPVSTTFTIPSTTATYDSVQSASVLPTSTTFTVPVVTATSLEPGTNSHSLDLEKDSSQKVYITDANQTGLDLSGDFTIEASVNIESAPSSAVTYPIVNKAEGSNIRSYGISYVNSSGLKISAFVSEDGGSTNRDRVSWSVDLGTGTWKHIAFVCDISAAVSSRYELFIDGVSQGNGTIDQDGSISSIYNGSAPFEIGYYAGSYYDGKIDEVRVWNGVRTSTEITNNKDKQLVGNESGLVGYWRFNNDLTDETSNKNDLTASGSPTYSTDLPFGGTETATLSPTSVTFTVPATTATYQEVISASVSPISTTYTIPATAATYSQTNTASANPVNTTFTVPTTTATHSQINSASISPHSITFTIPTTTATYSGVVNASVSPTTLSFTIPTTIATHIQIETASVTAVSTVYTPTTTTATYLESGQAGVSPISVAFTLPSVTATHAEVRIATASPAGTTFTVPEVTTTHDVVVSASVSPVNTTFTISSVTATGSNFTAGISPLMTTFTIPNLAAGFYIDAELQPVAFNLSMPGVTPDVIKTWALLGKTDVSGDWTDKAKTDVSGDWTDKTKSDVSGDWIFKTKTDN